MSDVRIGRTLVSTEFICQSQRKLINMENENIDELLLEATMTTAVVTIASSKTITVRKRN